MFINTWSHVYMYTCVSVYMHICIHTCMCVMLCIFVHACILAHVYVYILIHVYLTTLQKLFYKKRPSTKVVFPKTVFPKTVLQNLCSKNCVPQTVCSKWKLWKDCFKTVITMRAKMDAGPWKMNQSPWSIPWSSGLPSAALLRKCGGWEPLHPWENINNDRVPTSQGFV